MQKPVQHRIPVCIYLKMEQLNLSILSYNLVENFPSFIVMQPSEFTTAFGICRHGAAINKNHDGKILPTLFFMLMKTIKCKGKTDS